MERRGNLPSQLPASFMDVHSQTCSDTEGRHSIRSNNHIQLRRKTVRFGTWNVRTMLQLGKLQIFGREMDRLRMDVCFFQKSDGGVRGTSQQLMATKWCILDEMFKA